MADLTHFTMTDHPEILTGKYKASELYGGPA